MQAKYLGTLTFNAYDETSKGGVYLRHEFSSVPEDLHNNLIAMNDKHIAYHKLLISEASLCIARVFDHAHNPTLHEQSINDAKDNGEI